MPNISQRNFSSGWRPSDSAINGDPNGLLVMDNLDLDLNGSLRMVGGTAIVGTAYANNLHSIYSRMMNGVRRIYSGDVAGNIFRDNTSIGASGATDITAFGTAFNYTLVASGNTRVKDNGTAAVNLGVTAPTVAPAFLDINQPWATAGNLLASTVMYVGASAIITSAAYPSGAGHARPASIQYLQVTADAAGNAVMQNTSATPNDLTAFTGVYGGTGVSTPNDLFSFYGYTPTPQGCSLQIDILLVTPNAFGDQVSDYYSYKIDDLSQLQFDQYTGVFHIDIKRSDFTRVGANLVDWNTTYGVRITFHGAANQVINYLGTVPNPAVGSTLYMVGGSNAQNGVYEFMQVNVNNTGSYQAKSPKGPSTGAIAISMGQIRLTAQTPADAQVNEVWLFARSTGATNSQDVSSVLEQWYRVAVITNLTPPCNMLVSIGDLAALTLNITYNQRLASIASSSITDKIYSIVGPIQGRWYYFTVNMMYPSDLNNPDLIDPNLAVRTTGSNNEIFLWAKQVDRATILVGTSVDIYVLTGTYITLPDYTVDIFYHGLGCKYPPISYDADVYNGNIYYMATDGWRAINAGHENPTLTVPATSFLYKGLARYTYAPPNLKVPPGTVRFPIATAQNKLWCFVTNTNRCEVWDFVRQYWYNINYALGDAGASCSTQDGQIVAFYAVDKKLRELDVKSTKLIDGTTKQTFAATWTVRDGGLPRNRKDTQTFKSRVYTSNDSVSVIITNESNLGVNIGSLRSSDTGLDKFIDLSPFVLLSPCKTYQVNIGGIAGDFVLEDWEILFTLRPEQISYLRLLNNNFGTAARKRVRTWPHVIDTLGNVVTFTPTADDVTQPVTNLITSSKDTKRIYFTSDVSAVDYGATLHCANGLFEYYGELTPEIVQIFPVAKQFDQVGPEELFRYGKILKLRLRILPITGSSIPYAIYFQDSTRQVSSFSVVPNIDATYELNMPKGLGGNITRIELGPTNFDFHRFYAQIQVSESGRDTENQWINLQ